ncbi:MAG: diguanylate cyclase [Thermoleophilia bacterium]|nr:diguanylate cyclase [Thermoleophilia bacterium]
MDQLRTRYNSLSFRGRLLALLVAVSLIQATVAAYTFFQLQSKPADQRIQAQLNAGISGASPVIDARIAASSARLEQLTADPSLKQAIDAKNWAMVTSLLAASAPSDAADTAVDDTVDTTAGAYVTDSEGKVVSGTRPAGALIEQDGRTSARVEVEGALSATIHVPVAIDRAFLVAQVAQYVPKGVDIFVADEHTVVSTDAKVSASADPPSGLRSGQHTIQLGGEEQVINARPVVDGSVLLGAMIPEQVAAKQRHSGLASLWGFIALLTVLGLFVSWYVTNAVAQALRKFSDIARDLAKGNLARRIPVTGDDEVAGLATSFNDLAENLELRIDGLIDAEARMRRQVDLFGEALANATAVGDMLQAVCSLAMESAHASHARFWTIDDDGRYEHAASIGLRPSDTEPCGLEKAVAVRNTSVRSQGEPHWLVVPSRMMDGQIVGLLTLVSTGDDFSADDVHVAERIAVQAAVALDNARLHERLRLQATRDGLTGLPNHRSLQDELTKRLAEAYAGDMPVGIAMMDIDNFKRVNDTYGHPIGDEAIKAIGKTLSHGIGGMGMVGRYGGEEFVVIMPGCDSDTAMRIADRLREDITHIEVPLDDGGILKLTASFGVANVDQQHPGTRVDNAELLHQADAGMYNAKRTGKNRVELAGPDTQAIEMSEVEKAKLAARERGDVAGEQAAAAALETNAPTDPAPYDPFDLAA